MSTIEDIDLHVRSYRSALKSSLEITVASLTNSQLRTESILHPLGKDSKNVDFSALIYSLLRLPKSIDKIELVLMGQSPQVFSDSGFKEITTSWKQVFAQARRRTTYFHPHRRIMASFISSVSDVDDLVNILIAYQSEWNKFHQLLKTTYPKLDHFRQAIKSQQIINDLNINPKDWQSFLKALGDHHRLRLKRIYSHPQDIRLRLLAGSWVDYTKTIQSWWKNINQTYSSLTNKHLSQERIYLVSSNLHSLFNLITGVPRLNEKALISQLKDEKSPLLEIWHQIKSGDNLIPPADFLSFIFKNYQYLDSIKHSYSSACQKTGITSIPNSNYLDVSCQIFPISSLAKCPHVDSRLKITKALKLQRSNALILNIDYPLGFAAYHILTEIFQNVGKISGLYILGKAAVLNSEVGDIEIPKVIFDEHTQNTYLFKNCFNSFFPFPNRQGSILTHQKAVSVLGTFLQNEALLAKYSQNNLTVVEMESGPYLSAVTEATYDQQLPRSTIVDLNEAPLDIGIINYTSDTPYSQAKNLGAGSLELNGIEPVYLGSLGILQRIINLEEQS